MATKWTALRDQNLLLLIIENIKVDFNAVSAKWAEKFEDEDFKPTPRAISEHVVKLKKNSKLGSTGGTKWTAQRDQNLLLLIIENIKGKIDYNDVSAKWAKKFASEGFKPTSRAISEHVVKLKKDAVQAGGTGGTTSTPKSAKSAFIRGTPTSSKRSAPKTPTSSAKRARHSRMSDEEISEDGNSSDSPTSTKLPPRALLSRRGKVAKSYTELTDDEDEDNEDDSEDDGLDAAINSAQPQSRFRELSEMPTATVEMADKGKAAGGPSSKHATDSFMDEDSVSPPKRWTGEFLAQDDSGDSDFGDLLV